MIATLLVLLLMIAPAVRGKKADNA